MEPTMDTPRIALAKALATYLLRHSLDKQGEPLVNHALRVYSLCSHLTEDQQIAAILHDCAEDGKLHNPDTLNHEYWMFAVIRQLFGLDVCELVLCLTRENVHFQSYRQYIESIGEYLPAAPVKLADLADNLDPNRPIPDSLRQRYLSAKAYLESRLSNLSTN